MGALVWDGIVLIGERDSLRARATWSILGTYLGRLRVPFTRFVVALAQWCVTDSATSAVRVVIWVRAVDKEG